MPQTTPAQANQTTASVQEKVDEKAETNLYSFKVKDAEGKDVSLADYKGKLVLIVNVASRCGFTKQYEGLQKLYKDYQSKGLVILGFPSNQFFGQEPGTNAEIQKFCKLNYGVEFPVFAKIDVKGKNADPLYKWLTSSEKFGGDITWNFNKFLINQKGEIIKRYGSRDEPSEIEPDIKNNLTP